MQADNDNDLWALAEEWDAMREEHERQASLNACWRDVSATALLGMWDTGQHWQTGKKLSPFESEALVEAMYATFGTLPKSSRRTSEKPDTLQKPDLAEHPLLAIADDTILRPADVIRLTGFAKSTIKWWVSEGRMPKPQKLARGVRAVGWPARQLKAWLALRETGETQGNS